MRLHFISRLALLLVGAFMVVVSQESIWFGDTLKWMFIGGGAVAILISGGDAVRDNLAQRTVDFLTALVGAWMIVEVLVLAAGDIQWWSFGAGVALAGLSAIGLAIHEMSTERVVHELSVTATPTQPRDPSPSAA